MITNESNLIHRDDDLARAIRQRDIQAVVKMMFDGNPPQLKTGFKTETELWDFKRDCPHLGPHKSVQAWAEFSKDILGFYNKRGGVIIFGIDDNFSFCGATQRLDSKQVNDQIRKYLGDRIWVEYQREFIQENQRYVGLALVSPRGPSIERFKEDAPDINGKRLFWAGDSAIRDGDSTRVLTKEEADEYARKLIIPTLGKIYEVNEPFYRVLSPDYEKFVERPDPCGAIEQSLHDPRVAVTSLIGIGGAGKTALATWAALRAYEQKSFSFIVSITAKDRELTNVGIQSLRPALTSFETLLDSILEVLAFPEFKSESVENKERKVRIIIENSNGLLFVDNLETVDDPRIISFLDDLPIGVRSLITSRRTRVKVSARPIEIGPLTPDEVVALIQSLSTQSGYSYVADLSHSECIRIGEACDRIPLGIKWTLAKAKSPEEALAEAESITKSGRRGEELLEFCFRRIFDSMPGIDRSILQVLSLFQRLPFEAILVSTGIDNRKLQDSIDQLFEDALVQRLFDIELNDYTYTLLPLTRAFVYTQVTKEVGLENKYRKKLSDYFEAKDVKDPNERRVIREVRQGKETSESALLDIAQGAERRGEFNLAKDLYDQALSRNPASWKAARLYAELHRHKLNNQAAAIRLYERAAGNAPRRGSERALIFREWGMLLKDSGQPESTDLAIEKFEVALSESPNDVVAIHALATMLDRKGLYSRVIQLLEPLSNHSNSRTRSLVLPLLFNAYRHTGEFVKAAMIKAQIEDLQNR
jgi:tetratricopeptide (TPR) repeat protein